MKIINTLIRISFISLILFSFSLNAQGFLKASGRVIVNSASGEEVYLKGMGLGGWLVPEGYMLQTSGFANSPTQFKNVVTNLIGQENSDEFFRIYRENYVNKKDIAQLAEWGFNSIRLPLHYEFFTPKNQPGVFIEDGFIIMDSVLAWCKEYNLYLIPDLHCAPGAQNRDNISDSDGEARLWTEPANQTRTIEIWKRIAERYVNEEMIGGYDLINETAYDMGSENAPLRNLFVNITNAIRDVDTNHIIFIEGNWYATDFNGLTPPWDDNLVYSFHKYWNGTDIGSIQYLLNIRNTYNVPLWLGETGENSNAWFTECVELLKDNNIGWAWWPHKKISSIAGPLSSPLTPGYQTVLNYWNGSGAKPTVEFATNALFNQARSLNIDSCKFQPDVIDALLRQPGNDESVPFTNNIIPGRILVVNYDMGNNGAAYKDIDYRNVNGQGGATYNSGYGYRNDGVDIERCTDPQTGGFNVGWIQTGEYLNYTVNVSVDGNYNIKLRIACLNSGGKIIIRLDGQQLGEIIDVPVTGGYQMWQTIDAGNASLTAGSKKLQLQFFFGGFNINYIQFDQVATGVEDNNVKVNSYSLQQNYPNPFNPSTNIKFSIAKTGLVTLKVYNILGNMVADLINKEMLAGEYEIPFSASELQLSSGVYFYTLASGKFKETRKLLLMK